MKFARNKSKAVGWITLLAFVVVCVAALPPANQPAMVTLVWDYVAPVSDDLVFVLRQSANLNTPIAQWNIVATIAGTNRAFTFGMLPGAQFFTLTASNFWGESIPSNVASTPTLPAIATNISLRLGP